MKSIKQAIEKYAVFFIHKWALLFYDDKYLKGKWFPRDHYAIGWKKVMHCWYHQRIKGINKYVPWPVPEYVQIGDPANIEFDLDEMANFWSVGCYYQALGAKLKIGKGTIIAPGVGLITANHDPDDYKKWTEGRDIVLGEYCWIGMNAVVMPGVVLGDHTIVGAGSVVTKSFPDGYVVIAGNPAKVIKKVIKDSNGKFITE